MSLAAKYPTVRLMGLDVFALRMPQVIRICNQHIAERRQLLIGVVNVAKIVNARTNSRLREALATADIVLADGAPIVWLSRMVGKKLPERVAGIDLMFELLKQAHKNHYSVYFLGATPDVVEKAVNMVRRDYPGLRVAGYRDGYFSEHEQENVALAVKNSGADILFVGISPPKKEIFLGNWRQFMGVPICHGVGGSFDILAGLSKRAPTWMQKHGLEWLYRLIQEPRRLWRRYLVTNTKFAVLSVAEIARARLGKLFRKDIEASGSSEGTSLEPRATGRAARGTRK